MHSSLPCTTTTNHALRRQPERLHGGAEREALRACVLQAGLDPSRHRTRALRRQRRRRAPLDTASDTVLQSCGDRVKVVEERKQHQAQPRTQCCKSCGDRVKVVEESKQHQAQPQTQCCNPAGTESKLSRSVNSTKAGTRKGRLGIKATSNLHLDI